MYMGCSELTCRVLFLSKGTLSTIWSPVGTTEESSNSWVASNWESLLYAGNRDTLLAFFISEMKQELTQQDFTYAYNDKANFILIERIIFASTQNGGYWPTRKETGNALFVLLSISVFAEKIGKMSIEDWYTQRIFNIFYNSTILAFMLYAQTPRELNRRSPDAQSTQNTLIHVLARMSFSVARFFSCLFFSDGFEIIKLIVEKRQERNIGTLCTWESRSRWSREGDSISW